MKAAKEEPMNMLKNSTTGGNLMKHKICKVTSILLSTVLVLSLCACGNSADYVKRSDYEELEQEVSDLKKQQKELMKYVGYSDKEDRIVFDEPAEAVTTEIDISETEAEFTDSLLFSRNEYFDAFSNAELPDLSYYDDLYVTVGLMPINNDTELVMWFNFDYYVDNELYFVTYDGKGTKLNYAGNARTQIYVCPEDGVILTNGSSGAASGVVENYKIKKGKVEQIANLEFDCWDGAKYTSNGKSLSFSEAYDMLCGDGYMKLDTEYPDFNYNKVTEVFSAVPFAYDIYEAFSNAGY